MKNFTGRIKWSIFDECTMKAKIAGALVRGEADGGTVDWQFPNQRDLARSYLREAIEPYNLGPGKYVVVLVYFDGSCHAKSFTVEEQPRTVRIAD